MAIVNLNWYNLQNLRRYPLADSCTGETDDGRNLPNDIIVDCLIRFPEKRELGNPLAGASSTPFVAAVTVSNSIVTVVIGVEEKDYFTNAVKRYSIAAVSAVKPVNAGVHYTLTPLTDGVAGWIVFGDGIDTPFAGRFSTAAQTKIMERCARTYRSMPIGGLKIDGSETFLDGVVKLEVDEPLAVAVKKISVMPPNREKEIQYNAIFIGLDEKLMSDEYNPFSYFLHGCAGRPESGTCPKPGIQTINGIGPDCYGNVNIVFEKLIGMPFPGGLAVATNYGIADACQESKKLPQFYADKCCPRRFDTIEERDSIDPVEFEIDDVVRIGTPPVTAANPYQYFRVAEKVLVPSDDPDVAPTYTITWEEVFASDPVLAATLKHCDWPDPTTVVPDVTINLTMPEYPPIELPLCIDFCFCSGRSPMLREISGTFSVIKTNAPFGCLPCNQEPSPTITAEESTKLKEHNTVFADNSATVSLALLKAGQSDWAVGRTASTKLKIAPTGLNRDGGLVVNYRTAVVNGTTQIRYYAAVIDVARGALRLLSYVNGASTVLAQVPFPAVTDKWYKLTATTVIVNNAVKFTVTAAQYDAPNNAVTIDNFLVTLAEYEPLTGTFGLYANKSNTYFNELQIT
jgi:hypothetical protein